MQGGCEPSVFQQSVGSKYLSAQNIAGGSALVPTTSIYTIFDDIIQPEIIDPTSELPGALNLRIQGKPLPYDIGAILMTRPRSLWSWLCCRPFLDDGRGWAFLPYAKRSREQWCSRQAGIRIEPVYIPHCRLDVSTSTSFHEHR